MIRRRKILRRGKSDRYGVSRVDMRGESYRSGLEGVIHGLLLLQERAGEIRIVKRESRVYLHEDRFIYTPDFEVEALKSVRYLNTTLEPGEVFWVEANGKETDIWMRNYRLWKYHGPGKLVIYRGCRSRHRLTEVVIPIDACRACGRPMKENK